MTAASSARSASTTTSRSRSTPTDSDVVYVAWADNADRRYTIRVRRSLNRGVDWSGDLLTVPNATMAALAINTAGEVALMCQVVNGGRWETHLRRTLERAPAAGAI